MNSPRVYDTSSSSAFATLAALHKLAIPSDPDSLADLERHYGTLAEPVATIAAEELALRVQMMGYARELTYIWAHVGYAEMAEQIDAHLESEFPEADYDLRATVIHQVLP